MSIRTVQVALTPGDIEFLRELHEFVEDILDAVEDEDDEADL